jgi:hypothetical protein
MNGVLCDKAQAKLLQFPGGLSGSYTIPNSVTIGSYAFVVCPSLTAITVDTNNPAYRSVAGVLFDIGEDTLIQYPSGNTNRSYTITGSVTSIGPDAFYQCTSLTSVTIPNSVASIGDYAFVWCTSLRSAYFLGNAPPDDGTVFFDSATVYYLVGATGWGSTFGSVPAVLWNPQANSFSFTGGQFGFNVTGPANAMIVVEACSNLSHPLWQTVATLTLSGLGTSTFTDFQAGGYPVRFYRFRSP